MCGLAGILAVGDGPGLIPESWLEVLETSIAHRGPDGRGRFRDRGVRGDQAIEVALVHRRLSILDHEGGAQPMVSGLDSELAEDRPEDAEAPMLLRGPPRGPGRYFPAHGRDLLAVVFNGCIYNHRELRRELRAAGHAFASDHSDTEVLLHGTRAHGSTLADRLDGMYAYAVWSSARGSLTLARDPAGEKPLYITRWTAEDVEFVAFASVPAGLLALRRAAGVGNTPDPVGAAMWLKHGYWPSLPVVDLLEAAPGATYVLDRSQWPPPVVSRVERRSGDDSRLDEASLLPILERAVGGRLEADVPIGCFLSGGVDSSIVAALAQRAMASSGRRLRTFNVRMPVARMDESEHARAVADFLGTEHVELSCRASAAEDLVRLIGELGLPFGDSSLLPTYWVSAAAREHVTVALGGDGGDELFGGYDRYKLNSMLHRLRAPLSLLRAAPEWLSGIFGGSLGRVVTAARHGGYDDLLTILRSPQMAALLGAETAQELLPRGYAGRTAVEDARQDDFERYLPLDLMRKVDTASMAVALEVRAPFLERGLVGAALSAPLEAVYAAEGPKGLLRRAARTLAPAEAIDRKKAGFGLPMGELFREDFGGLRRLLQETLERPDAFEPTGLELRRSSVAHLMDEHFSERRDHGKRLYSLLVLALWARSL